MDNQHLLIVKIADQIDESFWSKWEELTTNFPDTDDAWKMQVACMHTALAAIICNFLANFKQEDRNKCLNAIIANVSLASSFLEE